MCARGTSRWAEKSLCFLVRRSVDETGCRRVDKFYLRDFKVFTAVFWDVMCRWVNKYRRVLRATVSSSSGSRSPSKDFSVFVVRIKKSVGLQCLRLQDQEVRRRTAVSSLSGSSSPSKDCIVFVVRIKKSVEGLQCLRCQDQAVRRRNAVSSLSGSRSPSKDCIVFVVRFKQFNSWSFRCSRMLRSLVVVGYGISRRLVCPTFKGDDWPVSPWIA